MTDVLRSVYERGRVHKGTGDGPSLKRMKDFGSPLIEMKRLIVLTKGWVVPMYGSISSWSTRHSQLPSLLSVTRLLGCPLGLLPIWILPFTSPSSQSQDLWAPHCHSFTSCNFPLPHSSSPLHTLPVNRNGEQDTCQTK